MHSSTITVHWHDDNLPVYSLDFQPTEKTQRSPRLATGGGDNNIRMWRLNYKDENISVEYLSTLKKHTQAVNTVRFNKEGNILATAGDDSTIILWTLSDTIVKEFGTEEDEDLKESWVAKTIFKASTSEIYDLTWSPNLKHIATGSMDNIIRIYDVEAGKLVEQLYDHNHYVQGIIWDPKGEYLISQSADRSINVYKVNESPQFLVQLQHKVTKAELPVDKLSKEPNHETRTSYLYHSEALQSFFRRLAFSPDGKLLFTPLGIYKNHNKDEQETNTVFIYTRSNLSKPVCHIPGLKRPAIAVAFSPILYKIRHEVPVFKLPYKMVFAIATQDSIIIYDTETITPLGYVSNLHYSTITDLNWETDGNSILISSADGFCSQITFNDDAFGLKYEDSSIESSDISIKSHSEPTTEKEPQSVATQQCLNPPIQPQTQSQVNVQPNILQVKRKKPKPEDKTPNPEEKTPKPELIESTNKENVKNPPLKNNQRQIIDHFKPKTSTTSLENSAADKFKASFEFPGNGNSDNDPMIIE